MRAGSGSCRQKALALDPGYVDAHVNLAIALASSHDFDAAFLQFREAVRLRPDNYAIRMAFGNALCEAGRVAEGIEQYQAAARLPPDSLDALTLLARAYARAGRPAEAVASLERARALANATGQSDAARGISGAIEQLRALMSRRPR